MKRCLAVMMCLSLASVACGVKTVDKKCDRKCLIDLMDKYLAALVRHDPSGVPLAADVQFVENTEKMPIGKGLWETASAVSKSWIKEFVSYP